MSTTTLTLLAAPDGGEGGLNFNPQGPIQFLADNIIPLIVAVVGLAIMFKYKSNGLKEPMSMVLILVLGLMVFFGAAAIKAFAEDLVHISFSSAPSPEWSTDQGHANR